MSVSMAVTPQGDNRRQHDPRGGRSARRAHRPGSRRDRARDLRPGRGGGSDADHAAVGWPCAAGRCARTGQEPAGRDARRRARARHQAGAVHPRPDAGRHHRQRGAGRGGGPPQLPLRARPGVLPVADGRRDQPRQPAHPVGAAAGDAGAARCGGGCRACAAAPVPRAGDAEPDRAGRHLPAARGAARPVPARGRCQLPGAGSGADHAACHHRHGGGAAGARR